MTVDEAMDRYRVVEREPGCWVIEHPSDSELIWSGSHWSYADQQSGVPLINFSTREQARHYGEVVLGGGE